jgi:hypothetical protein
MPVTRYQEGSIERVRRAKGPAVWVLRYRQDVDGKRVHRSRVLGTTKEFKSKAEAKRAGENLRAEINAAEGRAGRMTVESAWGTSRRTSSKILALTAALRRLPPIATTSRGTSFLTGVMSRLTM